MGNDMFNDEQLAHAEILQKETEDALGFWKDRALKAEAKLADKYLIEEQYEAACGDRDGLLRMVETLREQKNALLAERDAALSRARETEDGAVREAAERLRAAKRFDIEEVGTYESYRTMVQEPDGDFVEWESVAPLLSALSSPRRPETKDDAGVEDGDSCDWCKRDISAGCYAVLCGDCDRRGNTALFAPPADAATEALSHEFIEELRQRAYGPGKWSNDLEGDFGTWEAWRAAFVEFAGRSRDAEGGGRG